MKHIILSTQVSAFAVSASLALAGGMGAAHAQQVEGAVGVQNRSIGYVMVYENRSIYQAKDQKTQCPVALNDGPPEQFKKMFPEGTERTVEGTRLAWEGELWNPTSKELKVPYYEVQGNVGRGLNLDGKVDANDYVSPDTGEKGIDNQIFRAVGCTFNYRDGQTSTLTPQWRRATYNIFVIELTDVDSLQTDDDVTVTTYRGNDRLITDATGNEYLPGGSQTLDKRWGKRYIQSFKGKIKDGVLTTEAKDLIMPAASVYAPRDGAPDIIYKDMRFQLNVTDTQANGFMGGYADVWTWYYHSHKTRDSRHQAYGGTAGPTLYRALMKNADAHPDANGQNTAISTALDVKFVHVFVKHPDAQVAGVVTRGETQAAEAAATDARTRE
jgi:hypothetical protein